MKIKIEYHDVCFKCGNILYGKPIRNLWAITIYEGKCENCKQVKAIKPARDWKNEHDKTYDSSDWD